jgi:hypothetical protein
MDLRRGRRGGDAVAGDRGGEVDEGSEAEERERERVEVETEEPWWEAVKG